MVEVESHLPLAASCARRFFGKGIDDEDLYQFACEGLIKAAARYDPSRGVAFSTYAVPYILGEIKGAFRSDGTIKVSRKYKELSIKINKYSAQFEQREGRVPTVSELSEMLGVDPETVAEAAECSVRPMSIFDENAAVNDVPCDDSQNGLSVDERIMLRKAVASLDIDMRRLYELRFICECSQADVAKIFGVSQVTVSRREKSLVESLRRAMCDDMI